RLWSSIAASEDTGRRVAPRPSPRNMRPMVEPPPAIHDLIVRMEAHLAAFAPDDGRRHFLSIYRRTTQAFGEEIARGGFLDNEWVERWDLVFADMYLNALEAWNAGRSTPGPWEVAFITARDQPDLPALRHILFGVNVLVYYDLPH